ncbi:MAG: C1 family peptidase [Clostridia bacterium]|nr:C1 family peptidase [Clostridia bacterium]
MRNGEITKSDLKQFTRVYREDPIKPRTAHAIAHSGLQAASYRNDVLREIRPVFSIDIQTLPVTNQKASGRCWLFAALNLLREDIARQFNLEEFELSQNYLAFWDKFEKANYFLENILDTLDEPTDGRLISWLMTSYQDGGQWDMFINLIEKYGVVPKQAMPETFHSEATGPFNYIMNTKLRQDAAKLRRLYQEGAAPGELAERKKEMIGELFGTLCQCFGEPPEQFTWEFVDKDKNWNRFSDLTPQSFFSRFVTLPVADFVSIIHAPTKDKPFGKTFTVRYINNVVGGRPILYLNMDMPDFKALVLKQLKDGRPVWFGSDVGHCGDREKGAWFQNLYDYEGVLGLDLTLNKEDGLDYRHNAMNHAMVLTGVNLEEGRPNRWKIENSWGDQHGEKGYYIACDGWFDQYVYQAVIDKKYLSADQLSALKEKPIYLDPWDPMGTLAF